MTITFPTLSLCGLNTHPTTELLDDHRALEPPDPIPNSAVKRCIADGSVGTPHVRVGHRQALYRNAPIWKQVGAFLFAQQAQTCWEWPWPRRAGRQAPRPRPLLQQVASYL